MASKNIFILLLLQLTAILSALELKTTLSFPTETPTHVAPTPTSTGLPDPETLTTATAGGNADMNPPNMPQTTTPPTPTAGPALQDMGTYADRFTQVNYYSCKVWNPTYTACGWHQQVVRVSAGNSQRIGGLPLGVIALAAGAVVMLMNVAA